MQRLIILMIFLQFVTGCSMNGATAQQAKKVSPMKFPCLSNKIMCSEVSVRPPVKKALSGDLNGNQERGKSVAFDRAGGNCLACHKMAGGTQPGSRGPDLSSYASLKRSDTETYALVYDMRHRNPGTVMPPMGTNEILSDQEIRDVVAFLQSSN